MEENLNENPSQPGTSVDKSEIPQTEEYFPLLTWDDLRAIVETNNLSALKRTPSERHRYRQWTANTAGKYGSLTNYLLTHRLPKTWGTPPFTPLSSTPFEEPSDYRVLLNDWPYGFPPNIKHMIVWTRTAIPTDSDKGDMTPESRELIESFVKRYFINRLGDGAEPHVIWFKNWVALQSVRAIEHIHVLVRDVDPSIVEEWTREQEWHLAK